MTSKPKKVECYQEVTYDNCHWRLLRKLREQADQLMTVLNSFHIATVVHGSLARGDVNKKSDIDVFIPNLVSSFLVETVLEKTQIPINSRLIVQATPSYAIKAHIEIDTMTSVSFPLMKMRRVEREFYQFSGELTLEQLKSDLRVIGVDKQLMLIEPTTEGHVESSIIGQEEHAAKVLDISVDTVINRSRTLLKRAKVGRTGVFIKRELVSDETFELALKKLADTNPAVRRRLRSTNRS